MAILLNGEVRKVGNKLKKDKVTPWALKIIVEVENSYDGVGQVELNDSDMKKVYSVGQIISNMPVFPEAFGGEVVFKPIRNNGNGAKTVTEEKKPAMKV